jgi:LAGLIDADG DNA endonuclease family protein
MSDHDRIMPAAERDAFGHWLSGFTDGEGCFYLGVGFRWGKYKVALARFDIQLRADDRVILEEIRAFWGVGHIRYAGQQKRSRPKVVLRIFAASALANVVVPHFDRYPLRAKKQRDFLIWKRGVELYHRVQAGRIVPLPGGRGGTRPRWTPGEMELFESLAIALREQRKFDAAGSLPPPTAEPPGQSQLTLWG